MTFFPGMLRRAALSACVLATVVLASDLVSSQGRQNGRRFITEMVDGREVVAGEVLIRFRDQDRGALAQPSLETAADADEVETVGRRGLRRMHSRRHSTRALLAMLRANPELEILEPNYVIRVTATPNDPWFNNLWGLLNFGQFVGGSAGIAGADTSATFAWETTTGSRANVIGVVDTGIDYNHPDLAANIWSAPAPFGVTVGGVFMTCPAGSHGFNAITNSCDPMDDHSHGTHVAGTIGAVGNNGVGIAGVNWTASMMGLKFLSASGSGSTSNAIKLIDFAIQAKAVFGAAANVRVLSNSWGGGGYSQSLKDAIDRANAADMLFVAAAGNSNSNNDVLPHYPSSYLSPNVVSVAATDNRDRRASFSSYGVTSVDLGAPGVAILSTTPNNSYAFFNGTSMATPHVAGAAALALAQCAKTTAELKTALLNTVDPIASMSGITVTGGRLNVDALLRTCQPRTTDLVMTADRPSPQHTGTTITFTATASGGVTPYQYKWWLFNGVTWTMAQDWSASNTFAWAPSAGGSYRVGAWVRSSGNTADAAETPASVAYEITTPPRATALVLTSNVPSPRPAGTTIQWTATPTGGAAPYEYKWWLFDGATWTMGRDWAGSNTFAWTPAASGQYQVGAWVRSAGSSAEGAEAAASNAYQITAPQVSSVALAANRTAPQLAGTAITWTAIAAGGVAPYQYKWSVFDGATWSAVTGWTSSASYVWTPAVPNNAYSVRVWARSAGNGADVPEALAASPAFPITGAPRASSLTFAPNLPSPQSRGTTITWTAAATGGVTPYQFKWWLFDGVTWTMAQEWSASSTFTWTPAASGSYRIGVWVRSAGNAIDAAEVPASDAYVITAPPQQVTGLALAANRTAPQLVGTPITWTATPTGGVAPHQYKWWVFDGATWSAVTGWTSAASYVWTPASANNAYSVRAWVRSAGNGADAPESAATSAAFPITGGSSSATGLSIAADRASPQGLGATITWTATPAGGVAPYQYKWWLFNGVTWTLARDWAASNTLAWTPAQPGAYRIGVWVRSAGNTADAAEVPASAGFEIATSRVTALTVDANLTSPRPAGTTITWTATPTGGVAPYQYKWWLFNGVTWTMAQEWSSSNTLSWTPLVANPNYRVGVWVRSAGSTVDAAEVPASAGFVIQ